MAGDEFEDAILFVHDDLVAVLPGEVGKVGEAVVEKGAEVEGGPGVFEKGEAVDVLHAADLHAVEGVEAFAPAGGGEGGGVAGGVVVGEGDGIESGGLGGERDGGGGHVEIGAGGEAGVEVEVAEEVHAARRRIRSARG
jgi:hypothetical protein